uniref:Transcription factor CBF/NF-Y/archaeal histone domain-containing protein n=1 Tax=Homalodisca liturata TaxID=320908 RepID=A0A1B6I3Z1_9HEMI
MAETLSTLQKKKKTRFPISRIKKLMQMNEDVGKTTTTVPVILSRAIELFLGEILEKTVGVAEDQGAAKIQLSHFHEVVEKNPSLYEFLKGVGREKTESE